MPGVGMTPTITEQISEGFRWAVDRLQRAEGWQIALLVLFLVIALPLVPAVLLLVAVVSVVWFFFGSGPGEQPDHTKIAGWRARKAEATSYSEMQEYRDSIEEELEKGRKQGETPFRRLLRRWRGE